MINIPTLLHVIRAVLYEHEVKSNWIGYVTRSFPIRNSLKVGGHD